MSVRVVLIEPRQARARQLVISVPHHFGHYLADIGIEKPKAVCQFFNGDTLIVNEQLQMKAIYTFRLFPERMSFTPWLKGNGIILQIGDGKIGSSAYSVIEVNGMLHCRWPGHDHFPDRGRGPPPIIRVG